MDNGTFTWLLSESLLAEYKEVLKRIRVPRPLIAAIINLLREEAELVDMRSSGEISPDPGYDPMCACAENGEASFIATLNPKDFPQRQLVARVIAPGDPVLRIRDATARRV